MHPAVAPRVACQAALCTQRSLTLLNSATEVAPLRLARHEPFRSPREIALNQKSTLRYTSTTGKLNCVCHDADIQSRTLKTWMMRLVLLQDALYTQQR